MLTDQIFDCSPSLVHSIGLGGCFFITSFKCCFVFGAVMNMIKFMTLGIEIKYQENMGCGFGLLTCVEWGIFFWV